MRRLSIGELRDTGLPERMPANTRLGVWKRSTGFEVIHPYRRGYLFWVLTVAGLAILLALFYAAYLFLPVHSGGALEVALVLCALVLAIYGGVVLQKLRQTHHTRVRIDITPRALAISRINPSGSAVRIAGLSLERVEAIQIDGLRGICLESTATDPASSRWFGQGLRVPDLYYLALVLTKAMDGPDRTATNPNVLANL